MYREENQREKRTHTCKERKRKKERDNKRKGEKEIERATKDRDPEAERKRPLNPDQFLWNLHSSKVQCVNTELHPGTTKH